MHDKSTKDIEVKDKDVFLKETDYTSVKTHDYSRPLQKKNWTRI